MKRVAGIAAVVVVVVAFLLAGPAGIRQPTAPADLRLCWGPEPESFDPALVSGLMESWYLAALFEGLVTYGPDGITHAPGVAEEWTTSDDGRTWTFHLRQSRWSNGDPVTAGDFVRSWRRALDPTTGGAYADMLFVIRNGQRFHKGEVRADDFGVRAIDDRTLEVTLENPTPYFLDVAAFMTLLPVNERCVVAHGDDWIKPRNIVGNGPFLLESWTPNHKVTLKKNPDYWDADHVALERVECFVIDRAATALNLYATGTLDWLAGSAVPEDVIEVARSHEGFVTHPIMSTAFLRFNVTRPPFDDVRVRRAFAMAVDTRELTAKILKAGEIPATGLVPPGFDKYPYLKGIAYDPAAARELLRSVYADPARFPRTEFLTTTARRSIDIFEVLQHQWEKNLGIRVEAKTQETKVYYDSLRKIRYDIGFGRWIGDYAEPSTYVNLFIAGGANNRTGWGNDTYDRMVRSAAGERSEQRRYRLYNLCERMVVEEEAVIAPLWYNTGYFLARPRVRGISPNLMQRRLLKHISVER